MKILLIGEYSGLHATLAGALRRAGHEVTLVSDGDGWKGYASDVRLRRRWPGPLGSLVYVVRLLWLLPHWRGYDVVQVINPKFLDLKPRWSRWVFDYLKKHNARMSVGCFGDDYFVVKGMGDASLFAYTDFWAAGRPIDHAANRRRRSDWMSAAGAKLCRHVAERADCLIACLYEYYKVYDAAGFGARLRYVPLPVDVGESESADKRTRQAEEAVRVLVGVQRRRFEQKGTERIELLLRDIERRHPDRLRVTRVENVPFAEYQALLAASDVVVDQLYSYTPAMNALAAMARGAVVVSGGEEEYYDFIGERELRPVINLRPDADDSANIGILEKTLLDPERVARLRRESVAFVRRHHDADRVAQMYVEAWTTL